MPHYTLYSPAEDKGLAGAFVFDTSEDTLDYQTGSFTYELMKTLYKELQVMGHSCNPRKGCTVCDKCCKNYITDGNECDGCVAIHCS